MWQEIAKGSPLIRNRSSALLVVLGTGYLTALEIRAVLSPLPYSPSWILDPYAFRWPNWVVAAANVVFYLMLVYGFISIYRTARGKERVIVGGFCVAVLILPLKMLVASHATAIALIRILESICSGIAFFAALAILVESPSFGKSDAATARWIALFVGIFVLPLLVIGALLYFFPRR